ncbi:MAG TPA: DNA mismatch endonuclease Vsr [Firmicutes bacterium]|jgi:DNA mismatch endonuclease (patch repair protein)|nr:DNA mismatch endonuclease Vsr [Bacillota bacterium]
MADIFAPEKRSQIMALVKGRDTTPERLVRKLLHRMGYRFRLHRGDLPGCPDIVLPKYKTVILVHGCFWHHHEGCGRGVIPQTNKDFWLKKITANRERDGRNVERLESMGWRVLIIWECEIKKSRLGPLADTLKAFLEVTE